MKDKQRGASAAKGRAAPAEKTGLHPRNPHRGRYDFRQLIACSPELAAFVATNEHGDESIAFADPAAVKALNRALLKQTYGITGWDIPAQYLCPPIPGRADYLHYLADLLGAGNGGIIPRGKSVRVLDIGTGANCIYPLIGYREYGWQFVGTDIDPAALDNAQCILEANSGLSDAIELRLQTSRSAVFTGVVQANEMFDLTLCNPPFHASLAEAHAGTQRKWKNLGKEAARQPLLNFGGQGAELWCEGGEEAFVCRMIRGARAASRQLFVVHHAGLEVGQFARRLSRAETSRCAGQQDDRDGAGAEKEPDRGVDFPRREPATRVAHGALEMTKASGYSHSSLIWVR